jgi:hypothetical protein
MRRNLLSLTVLALTGISLLPFAALPTLAEGTTGKEEAAPKEPDDKTPKEKAPKEPHDRTERDGPPFKKAIPLQKKTRRVVVVKPHAPSPVYSYKAGANYCPTGLEPVSIAGEVSCGKPNQQMTHQQMLAHPASRTRYRKAKSKAYHTIPQSVCGVGMKGCSDR